MTNAITLTQVASTCNKSHTSLARGYVSRKGGPRIQRYSGRFGKGYAVYSANYDSTRYCFVTYYLEA